MKQKSVPGFSILFGAEGLQYDIVTTAISSSTMINIAMIINNELEADMPFQQNQIRLLQSTIKSYTDQQIQLIEFNLNRLLHSGFGMDAYELFHRRYLLPLIVKELHRNQTGPAYIIRRGEEFPFMLAYLLTIDEEHDKDRVLLDKALKQKEAPFMEYRLIWQPYIRQFQFNESVSPLFELFKLIALCHYATQEWRPFLRKYLSSFELKSIGQLANSYYRVFRAAMIVNPTGQLKKLVHINPPENVPALHLESLSINQEMGNKKATLLTLKKRPLFRAEDGRYRILDANFFFKHTYLGPFFGLVKTTGLEKTLSTKDENGFNVFSTKVSKHVIEEICFKSILEILKTKCGTLLHDASSDSSSDGYYREGKIIFLMECKAYILSDSYIETPDFDNLKSYIDENFIEKANGRPKGAGQIISQLNLLKEGRLNKDDITGVLAEEKVVVYPIILHNNFHFTLPGINEYINEQFKNKISNTEYPQFEIRNLILINLDWLFDMAIRKQDFISLAGMIDRYWESIRLSKAKLNQTFSSDNVLNSKIGFDEMYQGVFIKELPDLSSDPQRLNDLLNVSGINQAILDEIT
jgi:hypothetical protein